MVLVPKVLGIISKPLQMTYKISRLALKLHGTGRILGVADHLVGFVLDVKGKAKLSLTLLLIKLVHGKIRCQKLAAQACEWLDQHWTGRDGSNDALKKDLDDLFSPAKESAVATATPATRAGLLFIRDCLEPAQEADNDVAVKFMQPCGKLNVRAALTAFYGTATSAKLADALAAAPSIPPGAETLVSRTYQDLRTALRRDLTEMFIL